MLGEMIKPIYITFLSKQMNTLENKKLHRFKFEKLIGMTKSGEKYLCNPERSELFFEKY